jgi:MFS family permease
MYSIDDRYGKWIGGWVNTIWVRRDEYVLFASFVVAASAAIVGFEETATALLSMSHSGALSKSSKSGAIDLGMIMISKLGIAVGAVMTLPFADTLGRLTTLRWAAFAHFFMSFWSCYVNTIWAQMSARFMVNIAIGSMISTAPLYLAEVPTGFQRGQACSTYYLCCCMGSVTAVIMYIFFTLMYGDTAACSVSGAADITQGSQGTTTTAGACDNLMPSWFTLYMFPPGLVSLGMVVMLPALPESPRWLLANKTPDECLTSMKQLRKVNDVKREFSDIYQALSSDARREKSWWDLLTNQSLRYRVFLTCFLPLCHELTGAEMSKLQLYSLTNKVQWAMSFVMLGTLVGSLLGAYLCCRYIDTFGRQVFMVGSCIGVAATYLLAAWWVSSVDARLPIDHSDSIYESMSMLLLWLVAISTALAAFFHSGLANIMCFLQAEIFPLRARSKGVVLATLLKAVISCSFVASYNHWSYWSSTGGDTTTGLPHHHHLSMESMSHVFVFFGLTAAFVAVFLYLGIPDTNEIMLEDAEELFLWDESDPCITALPCLPCSLTQGCIGRRKFLIQDRHAFDYDYDRPGGHGHGHGHGNMGSDRRVDGDSSLSQLESSRLQGGGRDRGDSLVYYDTFGRSTNRSMELKARQPPMEESEMASLHKYVTCTTNYFRSLLLYIDPYLSC